MQAKKWIINKTQICVQSQQTKYWENWNCDCIDRNTKYINTINKSSGF